MKDLKLFLVPLLILAASMLTGGRAGAGESTLTPITEPAGAVVLNSALCGQADASAGLQSALNSAAGGTLWIPAGCILNTTRAGVMSSNSTVACGQGATFHSTVPLSGTNILSLVSFASSNITVEGCTFTAIYTPSMAAEFLAMGGVYSNASPVAFYAGSNIVFTDNAVTNQFGNEGVLFDESSNVTVSNNYFAYNFANGLQLSNCQYCNVTGNYSLDSGWDIEDAGPTAAEYDIETWSNNTFACDSTGEGVMEADPSDAAFYGGTCSWIAGIGCSGPDCIPGEYSNVTIENNTITGPGSALLMYPPGGAAVINTTTTNGGSTCTR